jgi:hypothetical protein
MQLIWTHLQLIVHKWVFSDEEMLKQLKWKDEENINHKLVGK